MHCIDKDREWMIELTDSSKLSNITTEEQLKLSYQSNVRNYFTLLHVLHILTASRELLFIKK